MSETSAEPVTLITGGGSGGDPAGWRHMVLTNVLGPALLVRAALPELRRTGGRIVLVGSVAGTIYSAGNIYGATRTGPC